MSGHVPAQTSNLANNSLPSLPKTFCSVNCTLHTSELLKERAVESYTLHSISICIHSRTFCPRTLHAAAPVFPGTSVTQFLGQPVPFHSVSQRCIPIPHSSITLLICSPLQYGHHSDVSATHQVESRPTAAHLHDLHRLLKLLDDCHTVAKASTIQVMLGCGAAAAAAGQLLARPKPPCGKASKLQGHRWLVTMAASPTVCAGLDGM